MAAKRNGEVRTMSCGSCSAILTPEVREVVTQSAFVPLVTVSGDGKPHLIVVGKAREFRGDDTVVFGVYKMVTTGRNLAETGIMQAAAVAGKKGYRLSGRARVEDQEVLFTVEQVDALL